MEILGSLIGIGVLMALIHWLTGGVGAVGGDLCYRFRGKAYREKDKCMGEIASSVHHDVAIGLRGGGKLISNALDLWESCQGNELKEECLREFIESNLKSDKAFITRCLLAAEYQEWDDAKRRLASEFGIDVGTFPEMPDSI